MTPREKTVLIYKFHELSDEAQQKAVDKLSDINVQHDWWDGDMWMEPSADQLKRHGISQEEYLRAVGSGALFSWDDMSFDLGQAGHIQFNGLRVADANKDILFRLLGFKLDKHTLDILLFDFVDGEGRHPDTKMRVMIDSDFEVGRDEQEVLETLAVAIEESFDGYIQGALSRLNQEYEYLTSREAIVETI